MENIELVKRSKMYLSLLMDGVHPVTGEKLEDDSVYTNERVKRCFEFISKTLDEYVDLTIRYKTLEQKIEKNELVEKKKEFSLSQSQFNSIKVVNVPITLFSLLKNINSVIDSNTTEKLSSTKINKFLVDKGLLKTERVKTEINKTVYKPSNYANSIGIIEELIVDEKTGEVKTQIKFNEEAQNYILKNINEIICAE